MDRNDWRDDPRGFALDLVTNGEITAEHLALICLKWMGASDVREALDANELSPRFRGLEED